jgi:hypothetical protein
MRLFAKLAITLGIILAANSAIFGADRDAGQPLYDIVAVGRGRGQIVLATLAAPVDRLSWRVRRIPVSPPDSTVHDVVLSASGTKALVVFSDGTPRIFDLTKRITGISAGDAFPPQHRLTSQLFPYASKGKVCLLDDLGRLEAGVCTKAEAAVVHQDGRVLYALDDGRLLVTGPGSNPQEELPYRLPFGAQFQLLAGHPGDARDFLVLVTERIANPADVDATRIAEIVDPRQPATPLAQFTDETVAALYAQLAFTNAISTAPEAARMEQSSETVLTALAAHLDEQTRPAELAWSFYRVAVNAELYAPVLEFAPDEPDYPSDVDIWQAIRPLAHGTSRQAYEAAYASMGDRPLSHCTSYVRTLSFPGTWLIEYWFYYPFDEGRAHPHIHDSEHIFVEVDKLGGSIRNIFASDHDSLVPNAIYSTLVENSRPVTLPLFAMVELGKHAMVPDLNHDGHFTRGVDDNLHRESYSFWGLRDRGSKFHFVMEPYRSSMSMARSREDRFSFSNAARLFPGIDVPADHQTCSLQTFPDDPPCLNCDTATAEAAISHLVDHPDARVPENIYKPYVLPWREVRLGVGIYDWREGRGQLSLGLVGDFRHMTAGILPIPARLALEYMWTPRGIIVPVSVAGQQQYAYSKSTMWAGARIERMVTNMQGFYFGVTPEWANISVRVTGGVLSPGNPHWQYTGVSYHAGYLIELPSAHKGNFTNHVGIVFRKTPDYPVLFEWRMSFGLLRRRGRHDFGARRNDRNPYQ